MTKFDNFGARDPLVPALDLEDFGPEFKGYAESAAKQRGMLSHSVRAMAHADEMAIKARGFLSAAANGGSLDPELTILIRLLVSNLNSCVYCATHQIKKITKMGVSVEKIDNINAFMTHPVFSNDERAALEFSAALTQDSANIPDDVCERFTSAYNPQQRVEITFVAAGMGMLNRFNDGLRLPIDDDFTDLARSISESLL